MPIRKLEQLGYTFAGDDWIHSANDATSIAPTITDELLDAKIAVIEYRDERQRRQSHDYQD